MKINLIGTSFPCHNSRICLGQTDADVIYVEVTDEYMRKSDSSALTDIK